QSAVYNSDGTSKITQLATGINSVVNNLDNLTINGRNLMKGTSESYTEVTIRRYGWVSPEFTLNELGLSVGEEITLTSAILTNGNNDRVRLRLDFVNSDGNYTAGSSSPIVEYNDRYGVSVTDTIPSGTVAIQWRIMPVEDFWDYTASYGRV